MAGGASAGSRAGQAAPSDRLALRIPELSARWVEEIAVGLAEAGRPLEGGWPATMSDARRLVLRYVRNGELSAATEDARAELARGVYRQARSLWMSGARSGS